MTDDHRTVTIDTRHCGPPSSGNGGWSAGLVATALTDGPAEVTLHGPPPLARPLELVVADGRARLLDGETLIAEARRVEPPAVGIDAITPDEAHAAEAAFDLERYVDEHPFPGCYACGPDRAPGDGLRIFPGEVPGKDRTIAWTWTPDASTAGADGLVDPREMWAALDCISVGPWLVGPEERPAMVLGRIGAEILRVPQVGTPLVAGAWPLDAEGRKHRSGSALWTHDGELLAHAWVTWIALTPEQLAAFSA